MPEKPYRGAGPALNDLLPGRVDVMFNNIGAVLPTKRSTWPAIASFMAGPPPR